MSEGRIEATSGNHAEPVVGIKAVGPLPSQRARVKIFVRKDDDGCIRIGGDFRKGPLYGQDHLLCNALTTRRQARARLQWNLRQNIDVNFEFLVVVICERVQRDCLPAHSNKI